jgi:hypothetical protein
MSPSGSQGKSKSQSIAAFFPAAEIGGNRPVASIDRRLYQGSIRTKGKPVLTKPRRAALVLIGEDGLILTRMNLTRQFFVISSCTWHFWLAVLRRTKHEKHRASIFHRRDRGLDDDRGRRRARQCVCPKCVCPAIATNLEHRSGSAGLRSGLSLLADRIYSARLLRED